jgi:hypothetical protein
MSEESGRFGAWPPATSYKEFGDRTYDDVTSPPQFAAQGVSVAKSTKTTSVDLFDEGAWVTIHHGAIVLTVGRFPNKADGPITFPRRRSIDLSAAEAEHMAHVLAGAAAELRAAPAMVLDKNVGVAPDPER